MLKIPYRIFFLTIDELNTWLQAQDFDSVQERYWDNPLNQEWIKLVKDKQYLLKISTSLFDENGNLINIKKNNWNNNFITLEVSDVKIPDDDDLPF